ncbi:glutamine synthetase family protein [Nioella nitratireducens]|uniref:glutamine synthetase family protein n=1 Tax=Nioella nitratireducens TaxID=1287720 RepID=UPI0008FCFFF6|nr:glutamine synthetase family protein [Nioella nitratireducens]
MKKDYEDYCAAHGRPDRIELMLCDINAVLRGKWLPGDSLSKLTGGSVRLPYSTYAPAIMGNEVEATGLGIVVGDPDGVLVPVEGTLKPVPWMPGNVAQIQVEMLTPEGEASPISPREILKSMLERYAERGWHPVVATELEFYILRPRERGDDPPQPPARTPAAQNYDLEVVARQEAILTEILAACDAQGLETDTLIAEYGPGQFEVNFHHTDDVLAAAETAVFFRRLVRGIVNRHGMEATFMAKPYADAPGNGMHVHCSILDDAGNNIFRPDAPGTGPSPLLKQAVAGVLDTMADLQVIFAPHMNSYRRFQPMSFAPSGPDWGLDNRAAGVRLPETDGKGARLEHRISGADVNPYLVLTAILGGILHGVDTNPDLPLPIDDPEAEMAPRLGHDWFDAVERFAASDHAAKIFGEDYRHVFAAVKNDEVQTLTGMITPVEYRYYLSRL